MLQPRQEAGSRLSNYEGLLQQGRYGAALETILTTPQGHPDHPPLQQRLPQLKSQIRRYQQTVISQALRLERNNQWQAAQQHYAEALRRLPGNSTLERQRSAMELRRQQRIQHLKQEQLIIKGDWLQQEQPLRQGLLETAPNNLLLMWEQRRIEGESKGVAEELRMIGEEALDGNALAIALRTLPLAVKLDPSEQNRAAYQRLDRALLKRQQDKQQKATQQLRDQQKQWLEQFNRFLASGDLIAAQEQLNKLHQAQPLPENIELVDEQLAIAVSHYIDQELEVGDIYYRSGDYQLARRTWEGILALRPDNEMAVTKLERVNRVIQKLDALRQKQLPATPEAALTTD